jgi:hypothetical protein
LVRYLECVAPRDNTILKRLIFAWKSIGSYTRRATILISVRVVSRRLPLK